MFVQMVNDLHIQRRNKLDHIFSYEYENISTLSLNHIKIYSAQTKYATVFWSIWKGFKNVDLSHENRRLICCRVHWSHLYCWDFPWLLLFIVPQVLSEINDIIFLDILCSMMIYLIYYLIYLIYIYILYHVPHNNTSLLICERHCGQETSSKRKSTQWQVGRAPENIFESLFKIDKSSG